MFIDDALCNKSYCNNLMLQQSQTLLHEEFRKLNLHIVPQGFLSTLVAKPTLTDQIIAAQKRDKGISKIKENIASGGASCFSTNDHGVVYFENRLVVPKNQHLRQLILKEARERGFMRLLKNQLPKMLLLGNHQAILKENNTTIINRETTSNSLLNVILDTRNTRIILLGSYDLILKGRFRHQGRKESVRSNVKVKLTEFLMEKWLALLQHEIVAIGFTA